MLQQEQVDSLKDCLPETIKKPKLGLTDNCELKDKASEKYKPHWHQTHRQGKFCYPPCRAKESFRRRS